MHWIEIISCSPRVRRLNEEFQRHPSSSPSRWRMASRTASFWHIPHSSCWNRTAFEHSPRQLSAFSSQRTWVSEVSWSWASSWYPCDSDCWITPCSSSVAYALSSSSNGSLSHYPYDQATIWRSAPICYPPCVYLLLLFVRLDYSDVLVLSPALLLDVRIQMVVPSLAALFAYSPR